MPELSIVLPVCNEESNLPEVYRRLVAEVEPLGHSFELIFVDDGSKDASATVLESLHRKDPRVKFISFSRNFGHQMALTAGLEAAKGNAVITMDSDLQHPVTLIPKMLEEWRAGSEVVLMVRESTADATVFKRLSSSCFYRLFNWLSDLDLEPGAADFRLLDRRALDSLNSIQERVRFLRGLTAWIGFRTAKISYSAQKRENGSTKYSFSKMVRFLRGLTAWIGFRTAKISYSAQKRENGSTKYSFSKMVRFAADGVTSFSTRPLKMVGALGLIVTFFGTIYGFWVVWASLFTDRVVPGWASTVLLALMMGGVQLMSIGVLGIYLGRIYEEVKGRPLYIVSKRIGF